MKATVKIIIVGATVTTFVLFVAAAVWMDIYLPQPTDPMLRLEYLKLSLEVYKAIGSGFLITLLGAAIPHIVPEARYVFETAKEARMEYSRVKTGAYYLYYKLADLNFSDALVHLETLHFQKHLASTYPQSPEITKWLKEDVYKEIDNTINKLIKQTDWDSLPRDQRLKILLSKDKQG